MKTQKEIYQNQSDTYKILFILYDNPGIDSKNIATNILSYSPNSPNSPNSPKEKDNKDNKDNKDSRTATFIRNSLNRFLNRLSDRGFVLRDENVRPFVYSLSVKGVEFVDDKVDKFQQEVDLLLQKEESKTLQDVIVDSWRSFFDDFPDLLSCCRNGFVKVDLKKLSEQYPELTDELLDNPENVIRYGQIVLNDMDLLTEKKDVKIIFSNPLKSINRNITKLRSKDINTLISVVGEIRSRGQTRVTVKSAIFECPSCGNRITVLQLDQKFKEPPMCGCGRKGKFRLLNKEVVDSLKKEITR